MPLNTPVASSTGTGLRLNLLATNDAFIGAGITLNSTANTCIDGQGSGHSVWVQGRILAAMNGIELGFDTTSSGHFVHVMAGGQITGNNGIFLHGGASHVENFGSIIGGSVGVLFDSGALTFGSSVINDGLISGSTAISRFSSTDMDGMRIVNRGSILAQTTAFTSAGSLATDVIINRGVIMGTIELDGGDDTYDGRGGTMEGEVRGGAGDDRFMAGAGDEVFDGGANIDTLDYRFSRGVQIALDGSFTNTGVAAGDLYINFENLTGSGSAADRLRGSSIANELRGFGGRDVLEGRQGADTLNGGFNGDTLTGGTGADVFFFEKSTHGGDVITDFDVVQDQIHFASGNFKSGLTSGVLPASRFIAHGNNAAGDASDRFIFRTTDKTLWFDADGTGTEFAPQLMLDLQGNITLTSAMIFMG